MSRKIVLCNRPGGHCCPEIEIKDDGNVEIRNDFDEKVSLTKIEFELLKHKIMEAEV